ncbi:RNA chaperone Hfq [Halarsenatibacter silvermanii]|uniref:Host factor-I protein n=1 Tax=Halarsenatibacter silvermanii TaxID=321763 RepID=A0A1G9RWH6_9FIRM|nr:RNA chaperone Hfq [Halarsenatibacter silvermanii]SDM27573.1 host factor-I protein [Halarsenatibacter silvermanii]
MSGINLQHNFLEKIKNEEIKATIYLKNGVQIEGYIEDYGQYTIVINSSEETQMILKSGITTIEPEKRVNDYFPDEF